MCCILLIVLFGNMQSLVWAQPQCVLSCVQVVYQTASYSTDLYGSQVCLNAFLPACVFPLSVYLTWGLSACFPTFHLHILDCLYLPVHFPVHSETCVSIFLSVTLLSLCWHFYSTPCLAVSHSVFFTCSLHAFFLNNPFASLVLSHVFCPPHSLEHLRSGAFQLPSFCNFLVILSFLFVSMLLSSRLKN